MSNSPKSVSWVSVAAIFGCFALFLILVYVAYLPHQPKSAYTLTPEGAPDDFATPQKRRDYVKELKSKQLAQGGAYAWADQAKGVVQLPIARAMELTVQEANSRAKK
jgi:acyl-CoA synthetase (AMP-forming)/AMP-acid ligase II